MNDASDDDVRVHVPRNLKFVGGHPCVPDLDRRDGWVCVCCELIDGFYARPCVRGLIVHLIEPIEVEQHPASFRDNPWVKGGAVEQARKWWHERAAVITVAPDGHVRFQVCPDCTRARMESGEVPFSLPVREPPIIARK